MSKAAMRDYRNTLNLPATPFPMQAQLAKREPARVAWWREQRTYEKRLERNEREGAPWILHDGPPYANGELHMGHFLNMVLKDMFVKINLLAGRWAKFVPGWDMHGLPIELETLKHLGIKDFHNIDPLELRARCKERAEYWFERQCNVRVRMGTFGDYEHPYKTVLPSYEAAIVNAIADLTEQRQIYRGLRSTLWCIHDETALAEAEIEYETKASPSIYVRFPLDESQRRELRKRAKVVIYSGPHALPNGVTADSYSLPTSVLIWTTTPWTIPSNQAIAVHPDARYALFRVGDEFVLVAESLAAQVFEYAEDRPKVAQISGKELAGLHARHPLFDRDSPIVLGDYVDLETGTGAVHTAPAHGADDFDTGIKYGLPIGNPVDARGHFTQEAAPYTGMQVFAANAKIVDDLREREMLWSAGEIEHSYPHCWRCHNPVIFRATSQWFIGMDRNDLRTRTLRAVDGVAYTPQWGELRQRQMIENHPEWCLSRQRTWGTPIPAFVCVECEEHILDAEIVRAAAKRFGEAGADAWWSDSPSVYLPQGYACPKCGSSRLEPERNIVDIWFESGVTHLAVLRGDLPWPSDCVLEGGDQYRGWFRSSLITAVAIRNRAPYLRVVKNGWVTDEQGRQMSKSRGTGLDAQEAMDRWGADVLRLWAASTEFVDDVRFGPNVIEQVGRVYRNVRNRIRFMLGNVSDMSAEEIVARGEMASLDHLACAYADGIFARIRAAYDGFDIHAAYLQLLEFESEMSALYFDAIKDSLYSRAKDDPRRRSAQSALLYCLRGFLAVAAPVLSFTCEEAWQSLPEALREGAASVFHLQMPDGALDAGAIAAWQTLRELRAKVSADPDLRDFEAKAQVTLSSADYRQLLSLFEREEGVREGLREALVVSQLALAHEGDATTVRNVPADGQKCARCWKYRVLGTDAEHPDICSECADVIAPPAGLRELDPSS
jgi:isoleucyl-tRNA synthetase